MIKIALKSKKNLRKFSSPHGPWPGVAVGVTVRVRVSVTVAVGVAVGVADTVGVEGAPPTSADC